MALVALLFAHHAASSGAEPRAAASVAGLSLVERQALAARRIGAARIFIFAERMPPGLAAALARLRDIAEVVRDPKRLARDIADGDRVLTIEEGLLADDATLHELADAGAPVLAAAEGEPPYPTAERLDSATFWAGVAIYDGRLVRTVAADLGEWDLQSTLLRSATGEGILRRVPKAADRPLLVDGDASAADRHLLSRNEPPPERRSVRRLYRPIERAAVKALLPTRIAGRWLAIGGVVVGGAAAAFFAVGWPLVGLLLALVAAPATRIGAWLGRIRLEPALPWVAPAFTHVLEPAWYAAIGLHLSGTLGVGAWALAVALIAFRAAALRQERLLERLDVGPPPVWAADAETLTLALVPFGLTGYWGAGLAVLAAYATATFFERQSRLAAYLDNAASDKL